MQLFLEKGNNSRERVMSNFIETGLLYANGIYVIVRAFNNIGWNKLTSLFEQYLQEEQRRRT